MREGDSDPSSASARPTSTGRARKKAGGGKSGKKRDRDATHASRSGEVAQDGDGAHQPLPAKTVSHIKNKMVRSQQYHKLKHERNKEKKKLREKKKKEEAKL